MSRNLIKMDRNHQKWTAIEKKWTAFGLVLF